MTLRDDPAQFHIVAGNVLAMVQENDTDSTRALLEGEYLKTSHKVVHDLTELNKQPLSRRFLRRLQ